MLILSEDAGTVADVVLPPFLSLQTLDVTKLTNIRLQTEIFKRINLVERDHYSDIEYSQYQTVGFKLLFYQREL